MPISTPERYIVARITKLRLSCPFCLNKMTKASPLEETKPPIKLPKVIRLLVYIPAKITLAEQFGTRPIMLVINGRKMPSFEAKPTIAS